MLNYENASGHSGETPRQWPQEAKLALDTHHPTLLMFAHPRCPCTRASLNELNRLLARFGGQISPQVVFLKPKASPEAWTQTDLRRNAAAIPGVAVWDDLEGAEAHRFGAETSGYVLLYDPEGHLLFSGGITAGRSHAGDNAGSDLIASLLSAKRVRQHQTPVYGCALSAQGRAAQTQTTICRE